MIGQKRNLEFIDRVLSNNTLPHFLVFVGPRGSGKTMLAKYVLSKLNEKDDYTFIPIGIGVNDIREMITSAYTDYSQKLYYIADADTMSIAGKNAMLKVTEEPPKSSYIIMTVQDDSSLLATIKSRATVLYIEPYSKGELRQYCDDEEIISIASTPYEIDLMKTYGKDFIDYVNLVIDNIAEVEPANAFKSSGKLAIKNEEGYDVKLFFSAFLQLCYKRMVNNDKPMMYARAITVTSKYLNKFSKLGISKQQIYDKWVFDIREVMYDDN
jgi:DNA polymerase III delta prime subunit